MRKPWGGATCVPVDDGNACTEDLCIEGVPANPPKAVGSTCDNAGTLCDGNGNCVQCVGPTDCPDPGTECKRRTCTDGVCGTTDAPNGTVLTTQESGDCRQVQCDDTGTEVSVNDDTDVPADDGNPCTDEVCSEGAPSHPDVTDGTDCNDGDLCTTADSCQSGVCQPGVPVLCTALDECHVDGACDPSTGVCSNPEATDGGMCTLVAGPGSCSAGTCVGCGDGQVDGVEACDDGNAVEGDGCDTNCTATACGNGIVSEGEQCDDGNLVPGDGCSDTCTFEPLDEGVFGSVYSGSQTRGFYFQAPVAFTIHGLRVPTAVGSEEQNIQVMRFDSEPAAYPATSTPTTLAFTNSTPNDEWFVVDIPVAAGDWIGILGARGDGTTMYNAYAAAEGPLVTNLGGTPVTIARLLYQGSINDSAATAVSTEAAYYFAQVELQYNLD